MSPGRISAISRRRALATFGALAGSLAWRSDGGQGLDGAILLEPASPAFATYARCYNARIERRPAAVALCRNETGIVSALAYARRHNLAVAIKAGGHSFEGFCLNNGGLVIDLSQMRQQQRPSADTLLCGPGWRLGELYDSLLPSGKLLPAGSCGGVGIAGLTLGGGYGLFARGFGLTCDHLTGVRVVTATGEILDSDERTELLWACRGGGNGNFGVVSELRFRLADAPPQMIAHRFKTRRLKPARAVNLLRTWMALEPSLPPDAFSAFVLNGTTLTILLTSTAGDTAIQPIVAKLEAVCDETRKGSRRDLHAAIQPFYGRSGRLPFKNASGGFYQSFEDLETIAGSLVERTAATPGVILQVNVLGGAIAAPPDAVGSAYPHRTTPFLAELQAYWDRPSQAASRIAAVADLQGIVASLKNVGHYRNYPDLNIGNAGEAYYGPSLPRLRALKRELDPDNRIRHPQSIS